MSNSYYNASAVPVAQSRGSSSTMRAEFSAVAAGLDKFPTPAQVWGQASNYAADTGTANAYVVSIAASYLTSYQTGMRVRFKAANANTGASTVNVNGLGAKSIVLPDGVTALSTGAISAGQMVDLDYDGTNFQIKTALQIASYSPQGRLIGVQVFAANGTYTPTAGTTSIVAEVQAGGGAGGGAAATGAGQVAAGGGGGAGGYAKARITSGFSGAAVVVGTGGIGVSGAAGGNGTSSSFGALVSATGGAGGPLGSVVGGGTVTFVLGGLGGTGTVASGPALAQSVGAPGEAAIYGTSVALSGSGGASMLGGGGRSVSSSTVGVAAGSVGAGGSGSALLASTAANAGGAGGNGVVIVWEYA